MVNSSKSENPFCSKLWRINNLYRVIDKNGNSVPFRLNPIQQKVIKAPHKRKLLLKARQVGMSTMSIIDMLDDTLFTDHTATGIVSYSLDHAQHIFKRIINHALDTFLPELRDRIQIESRSAREITFGNGSFLRVDTSLRGGTYQNILVSEFGKTCARTPLKAEEVITGTLNAVPLNGKVTIESTGEGMDGYFAEMCLEASQRGNDNLNKLDYELMFFPWFDQEEYNILSPVEISCDETDYFNEVEELTGTKLSLEQRYWYVSTSRIQKDKMKQEFPSTVKEAFISKSDAYYFAEYIERAYKEDRCLYTSLYDACQPVYVSMDIGVNDLTVMIFFQIVHGEIRVIDYYKDNNKGVDFYAHFLLQDKPYLYHTIYFPHDSENRSPIDPVNSYEKDFRRMFSGTATRFIVLPRTNKQELISYAKNKFNRCVFNVTKVKTLLDQLSKYRKRWHETTGSYLEEPQPKQMAGHYADAFQYMAQACGMIERGANINNAFEKHREAVAMRLRKI